MYAFIATLVSPNAAWLASCSVLSRSKSQTRLAARDGFVAPVGSGRGSARRAGRPSQWERIIVP